MLRKVINSKKSRFHWVHLIAVFILGSYFVLSKVNLVNALTRDNLVNSFFQMFIFGLFFTYLFLYLFSHENFFPFAKEIENKEKSKEEKLLKKYIHHGKVIGTFLIGLVGGPVFLSLTTRLLLNNFRYKYVFIFITILISTFIIFSISTGLVRAFD